MKLEYKTVDEFHAELLRLSRKHGVEYLVESNSDEYIDRFKEGWKPLELLKQIHEDTHMSDDPFCNY